jgi:hypothetical protein
MSVLYDLRLRVHPLPGKATASTPVPTPFWSRTGDAARAWALDMASRWSIRSRTRPPLSGAKPSVAGGCISMACKTPRATTQCPLCAPSRAGRASLDAIALAGTAPHLDPSAYNLKTIFQWLARQQHDPMAGLLRGFVRAR